MNLSLELKEHFYVLLEHQQKYLQKLFTLHIKVIPLYLLMIVKNKNKITPSIT